MQAPQTRPMPLRSSGFLSDLRGAAGFANQAFGNDFLALRMNCEAAIYSLIKEIAARAMGRSAGWSLGIARAHKKRKIAKLHALITVPTCALLATNKIIALLALTSLAGIDNEIRSKTGVKLPNLLVNTT